MYMRVIQWIKLILAKELAIGGTVYSCKGINSFMLQNNVSMTFFTDKKAHYRDCWS